MSVQKPVEKSGPENFVFRSSIWVHRNDGEAPLTSIVCSLLLMLNSIYVKLKRQGAWWGG